jgi:membrane protein DedA with SNARE-associated domain
MGDIFNDISEWMTTLPAVWAYVTILAIAYGENVIPPVPGDLIVVFGGYLAGTGKLDFTIVVLLSAIGGTAGFMTMYAIGRRVGDAAMDPSRLRWLPKDQIARASSWLDRWGYWVVAFNRFLSGARSVISLTVGMAHTDATKTAACAALSAVVWTLLITYAGYALGENWRVIASWLALYGRVMLTLSVLIAGAWLVYWYVRRQKARKKI